MKINLYITESLEPKHILDMRDSKRDSGRDSVRDSGRDSGRD